MVTVAAALVLLLLGGVILVGSLLGRSPKPLPAVEPAQEAQPQEPGETYPQLPSEKRTDRLDSVES